MESFRLRLSALTDNSFPTSLTDFGNDKLTNQAPPKNGNENFRALLNSTAKNIVKTEEPEETFWVKKNTDAKKLSESLLRKHFGFEDADIELYKARYNGLLPITDVEVVRD